MIGRRQVLVGGGSGLAALSLGLTADPGKAAPPGVGLALFLYDSSIAGAARTAALFGAASITSARFSGDIGTPWIDIIEPIWRRLPRSIAGLTHGGAFFCLSQLAAGHGLACTFRSAAASKPDLALTILNIAGGGAGRAAEPGAIEYGDAPLAWLLQPIAPGQGHR